MDQNENVEAQSLTGQANTFWKIDQNNRKRQRFAILLLFVILITVIIAIFIWFLIFSSNETIKCDNLQGQYCSNNKQEAFFKDDLFKLVYEEPSKNYIFRSITPFTDDYKFSENEIMDAINKFTGKDFTESKFNLILYTLATIDNKNIEVCNLAALDCYQQLISGNSEKYTLKIILKEVVGDKTSPYESSNPDYSQCKVESLSWQTDELPSKVDELNDLISAPGKNVVIINSNKGIDRVGEISASFKLSKNFNFTDTMLENIIDLNQTQKLYLNSIMWYCCYLSFSDLAECHNIYEMKEFENIIFD